jgi:hypothetical protein
MEDEHLEMASRITNLKKKVSSRLDDVHATSLGPPPTTSRLQPAGPTWKKKE